MAVIKLGVFGGEKPLLHPTRLGEGGAQVARHCRLKDGTLRPIRGLSYVRDTVANAKTIFKYTDQIWFDFTDDVSLVRSVIAGDAYDRVYITGLSDGPPRFTYNAIAADDPPGEPYPTTTLLLGIPAPTAAPTATVDGTPDDATDLPETRFYVYCLVGSLGEEGPPSPVSAEVEWRPGQHVDLSSIQATIVGDYDIDYVRIYRTASSATNADFLFVADIPWGDTTYADSVLTESLGEAIPSAEWDPPPAALEGIVGMPGGYLAGFYGNTLCFSEAAAPHAWPVRYQLTVDYPIQGLGVFGNTLVVATEGTPYLAQGSAPGSMVLAKLEINEPCIAKRSIVDLGTAVGYASPNGLVVAGPTGVELFTRSFVDRADWARLVPTSFHAYQWENEYLCAYDDGTTMGLFSIDILDPQRGLVYYDGDVTAGLFSLQEALTYVVIDDKVYRWDYDCRSAIAYNWRSGRLVTPTHVNFGALRVLSDGYPVMVRYIADGRERWSGPIQTDQPVRLPSGFKAREHEVEVGGAPVVYQVAVATSLAELREEA